jgi:hypothetical protein
MTEPSNRIQDLPLVRDFHRYHGSLSDHQLPAARDRYEYLYKRRDELFDKVRNGMLVLNSASLLAVLTAINNEQVLKGKFGVTVTELAMAACAFALGLVLAAAGFFLEANRTQHEVALQFGRLICQMQLHSILDSRLTEESEEQFREIMQSVHELPPADFKYSLVALVATHSAGGLWVGGIALLVWKMSSVIGWTH